MKKIKMLAAGLAAAAAVSSVGGTWAVWTQHQLAKNEYMVAKYSTFLREEFKSPDKWLPGEEEKKAVWVENEGTAPAIAKITMSQSWIRQEDVTAMVIPPGGTVPEETVIGPRKGEPLPIVFEGDAGKEYAAVLKLNKEAVVVLEKDRASEPGLRLDIPEVQDLKEAEGKWLLLTEEPDEHGNFTFYYMGQVEPGGRTPTLLDGVEMNPKLEATVTGDYTYFEKVDGGYKKVTVDTVNSKYGYDSCHFTLGVNMQTVQATKGAVEAVMHRDSVSEYIAGYIAGSGEFDSSESPVKRLYFRETDGVLSYTPYRTADGKAEDGNWFMSFTNMVPGGTYKDRLEIENGSRKGYTLYMRIVPREGQSAIQEELLEKIAMKVYFKDQLIYDGDATGFHYQGSGEQDMQGLVPLGAYRSGDKDQIRVELALDPGIGLEDDGTCRYADVLTKIDWEFMAQEMKKSSSGGGGSTQAPQETKAPEPQETEPEKTTIDDWMVPTDYRPDMGTSMERMLPKTGDDFPAVPLMVTMGVSLAMALFLWGLDLREKRKKR